MTEEERDEMMHRNWVAQMNGLGFDESGYMLDLQHPIRLVEEPKWISVQDKLPKDCEPVLVYMERDAWDRKGKFHRKKDIEKGWQIDGVWHVDGCSRVLGLYWMPLPEPPQEG